MNFRHVLPCLILPLALSAQAPGIEGGGRLTIGTRRYRFEPKDLASAGPREGLSGAIRLKGLLIPEVPEPGYRLELVILKKGGLYRLDIRRPGPGRYPDTWAATVQTRVKVIALEDHPGGRVELSCEGPLTGVVDRRPVQAHWEGRLWAVFPEPEEED